MEWASNRITMKREKIEEFRPGLLMSPVELLKLATTGKRVEVDDKGQGPSLLYFTKRSLRDDAAVHLLNVIAKANDMMPVTTDNLMPALTKFRERVSRVGYSFQLVSLCNDYDGVVEFITAHELSNSKVVGIAWETVER